MDDWSAAEPVLIARFEGWAKAQQVAGVLMVIGGWMVTVAAFLVFALLAFAATTVCLGSVPHLGLISVVAALAGTALLFATHRKVDFNDVDWHEAHEDNLLDEVTGTTAKLNAPGSSLPGSTADRG
jgi:fatty acid desaturase